MTGVHLVGFNCNGQNKNVIKKQGKKKIKYINKKWNYGVTTNCVTTNCVTTNYC
jgi:hypothetical protein